MVECPTIVMLHKAGAEVASTPMKPYSFYGLSICDPQLSLHIQFENSSGHTVHTHIDAFSGLSAHILTQKSGLLPALSNTSYSINIVVDSPINMVPFVLLAHLPFAILLRDSQSQRAQNRYTFA
ncbi:predicted protein [Coccidioides posadasii str. Silveira]|uniref:Predicted protein n=1 Tax=Coccidioides posadasii (strain RMSCC 757 / Silveira) TaxID=443226 RepID=E9DAV0_COCPS|nr:predicted protein [Coccidioides posadasii str. Silveira]